MYEFIVNGKPVSCAEDMKLLKFLREELRLTSVKDGCGEGACGTCTVIVDGKAVRACLMNVSKCHGKNIVTTEGLTDLEKDVYGYSFMEAGAVQCGFCIPGMVMSAKALIDLNPQPTPEDVKKAIRGNICRCTGYIKIEKAILLAAEVFRDGGKIKNRTFTGRLGEDMHRVDAVVKTLGQAEYADDMVVEGMAFGKALRSKYPRALVKKIDTSAAEKHPDAIAVIRGSDVPGNIKMGHLVQDWDALIAEGQITRYVGDAIVLAVSRRQESLDEILELVRVEYQELKPMLSPTEAMADGAPKIHEKGNILSHEIVNRGDAEAALKNSKYVVTKKYSTPFTEHAFMEPECAVGLPDADGVLVYTGSQSVFDEQREISNMLGLPREKVRVISKYVGGGFGGKEDMSVQHHAALAAYITKCPVKVKFSRQESLLVHPKRHAMEMEFTAGCDENGILTGLKATIVSDTGAYASLGGPVIQRACTHAGGPYNYQNVFIDGKAVYTNNPPAGAYRGFGVTQSCFAMESNLNLLAEMVGISPWEIRYRNAIKPGQTLPNGQIADPSTAAVQCLLAVKDVCENNKYAGLALGFKNSGLGMGVPDTGRAIVSVEQGKVHIRTSAACVGQGMATVTTQIVCETLGIPPEETVAELPDTLRTPNSGTSTASRQTVLTGEAVRRAAVKLKEELKNGLSMADLEGREFYAEYLAETDPLNSPKDNPVSHVAYGYAAQVAILNDAGRVEKVVAAYDVGRVVNPKSAEGQIEGGVAMGLGYGLTEDFPLENGVPAVKYGTLGLFRSTDMPEVEIKFVSSGEELSMAYGAKGVGELATIPTAPALQAAYYAYDHVFRTKLPLEDTPYKKKK